MTTSIVEYLTRRKREIDKLVDQTYFRLMEETTGILRLFPRTNYVSRKLLAVRYQGHKPTIASIIAEEQEPPASRPRLTLDEDLMTNCKIGKQIIWKGKDFELLHEMQMMMSGGQGTQVATQIERHYFGAIADLVPATYDRSLMIALQVAMKGQAVFTALFCALLPNEVDSKDLTDG